MRMLAMAALCLLAGCNHVVGCDAKTETVELVPSDPFYAQWQAALASFQQNGWKCDSGTPIRNAFGSQIGTRYVCTICN